MSRLSYERFVVWAILLVCPIVASAQSTPKYDAIIVGAGLSGLTAATRLQDLGFNVLVLEANNRVGGRMYTIYNPNTGYVDLGGTFIDTEHANMWRELAKYNLSTYSAQAPGDSLCRRGGKVLRYKTAPPFPTQDDTDDYDHLVSEMARLTKQVEEDESVATSLDNQNFQQWLDKTISSPLVKENIKMLSRTDMCADPSELSCLFALQDFDSAGGLEEMNTYDETDEFLCYGGVQQLPLAMARQLRDKVLLRKAVKRIQSTSATVTVTTADNSKYQASYVIMAVPPRAQRDITLSPPPSAARQRVIQNMPMGSVIKTFVFYRSNFWRPRGLSGYTMCEADNCTICTSLDYTKPDGSFPSLVGFISGNMAKQLSNLTQEQRKVRVIDHYARMFNIPEMRNATYYVDYNWIADQFTRGGYSAIRRPGILAAFNQLKSPEGLIHYAGTESAEDHDGYMDGAIEAGNRAALEVACELNENE